jgi:hypothetical protein
MTRHVSTGRTLVIALATMAGATAIAASTMQFNDSGVAKANLRADQVAQPNVPMPGAALVVVARGSDPLENPSGLLTRLGTLNDFPPQTVEATKTEPDENTYLVLSHNPGGPAAGFDYGRHFLFQGHENANDLAYVTRVNLDVKDAAHRVTLLTPVGADGKTHFNSIDGSTWNPFTGTLLFTQEAGGNGGVIEIDPDWGTPARTLYGQIGRGGFEGIHPDDLGNLILFEDAGGTSVNNNPADPASPKNVRIPNSFVFRFVPEDPTDLSKGGVLQALQVTVNGHAMTFQAVDAGHPTGDAFSANQLALHTPGTSWPVRWVTVHDTATDGTASFDANALAKTKGATPFKRPENGVFLPGSGFRTFFFDSTGDTSAPAGAAAARYGAWGALWRVDLDATRETGTLALFFLGDAEHAAFDNVAFADNRILLAAEDRGDGLHTQLSKLDSIWAFDVRDEAKASEASGPVRLLALGRDAESTADAHFIDSKTAGFQNDGDNEPTGLHVSNGDTAANGLLGRFVPSKKYRWFFTQQHGANTIWEIKAAPKH